MGICIYKTNFGEKMGLNFEICNSENMWFSWWFYVILNLTYFWKIGIENFLERL